jgi:hypothetical protein
MIYPPTFVELTVFYALRAIEGGLRMLDGWLVDDIFFR